MTTSPEGKAYQATASSLCVHCGENSGSHLESCYFTTGTGWLAFWRESVGDNLLDGYGTLVTR